MIPHPIEDRRLAGILLMLCAFLCFTGIDSCAKWLVEAGMPAMQVVFVRYFVHMTLAVALFLPAYRFDLFALRSPRLVVMRALFLLASTVLNFIAVGYLPLTLTAAIAMTTPLWVCALSIPLLGERVGPRRWAAILVGFLGVLVMTRPWSAEAHWAAFLSVAMALAAALYAILTRRLAGVESTATQQVYAAGIAAVAIAPVALLDWQWPERPVDWAVFATIGAFGWAGHQVLTVAHRLAPASILAPFVYVQMVFMTLSSWLVFHVAPDAPVLAGAAIVLASGLYIWLRERRLAGRA